jgi:hypothetical protein
VTLAVDAGCVWLKNAGDKPVAAEVKFGDSTVKLRVEGGEG